MTKMSKKETKNNVQIFHDIGDIGESSNDDDSVVNEEYEPVPTFNDGHGHNDVDIQMPETHFHEDIQLSHSNKKLGKDKQSNNTEIEETSFQNANPTKIKVLNGDSHDEIQFLESIVIKENKNAELEVSTPTNKKTDLSNNNLSTPQNNDTGNISLWFKYMKSLKSVNSAEKYVVTDKQQPLTWKKKLQYITLFVGVAILLVILVVIAVITSGSIKEEDTATKPPAIKIYKYVHALMDLTVNASFTSALQNKESYIYMAFLSDFCLEIDKIYRNTTSGIGENYVGCSILKLRSGSIIVSFTIYTVNITEESLRSIVEDILQKHLLISDNNMLGRFQIIISSLKLIQVTTVHLNDPPEVQTQLPSTTHSIVTDSTTKQSSTLPSKGTTVDINTDSTAEPTSSTTLSESTTPKPTTTTAVDTNTDSTAEPTSSTTLSESTTPKHTTTTAVDTNTDSTAEPTSSTTLSESTTPKPTTTTAVDTNTDSTAEPTSSTTLSESTTPKPTTTTAAEKTKTTTITVTDATSTVGVSSETTSIMYSTQENLNTSDAENTESTQETTMPTSTVDTPPVSTYLSTPSTSKNTLTSTTSNSSSRQTTVSTTDSTVSQHTPSSTVDDQTTTTTAEKTKTTTSTPSAMSTISDQQTTTSSTIETTVKSSAVNGSWSSWSFWSGCLATCGVSLRQRNRKCDNPIPQNGGQYCVGNDTEYTSCTMDNCPIDGMWTDWSGWSSCNVTCKGGTRIRYRTCTNPRPKFGGLHCVGSDSDTSVCNGNPCPIDGRWSDWSSWTQCDVTCGNGSIFRARSCTTPQHGGHDCIGNDTDILACTTEPCPVDGAWSIWSNWGDCSVTCGDDGSRDRQRSCSDPAPQFGGSDCIGNNTETSSCDDNPCPINGQWAAWEGWDRCTHTCGDGYKSRTRECSNPPPMYGGDFCKGFPKTYTDCAENPCTVQGYWTSWSDWGACNASCGGGIRIKQRTCFHQDVGDDALLVCIGDDTENDTCNTNACPIDGGWSEWTEWEECSATCGKGIKSRNRTCTNPVPNDGGEYCVGNYTETNLCNTRNCPGGSCTSASAYLQEESVYIVCTITGMPALITTAVKHNEQDIAILKETKDVQYVVETDIVISVVYDENTTISLYFRNVTCEAEGIYRIEVQDDTFNGLDITGTLSIKVKPTVPIFYVNSNKLDGLPYRREDYQHQCFGNVGKPAGQLVIEFQPFNTSSFKAIPSSNLVILQNSTRNIDCDNFQNLTFRMNLTTEIEHGKLRCRVINDEILIDERVASEEDLSAWPRNTCTDVVRFINDGPATMTCTMNRTREYDEIQIIKIKDGKITNISKIDNNGNIHYLSSANIEITLAQKYDIDLKFQNISCADEGHYILVSIKELKMIATVSGTLTPQSKPTDPTLIINPNIVIDSSLPLTGHRCYGNVGYPPGELALDILIVYEGERKYFETPEDVITSLNDVRYSENCEGYQNFTFTLNASSAQNGKMIRCRVKTSFLDDEVFADESYLTLIPKDICKCNTIVSGIRRGHPGRCDHYVECVNMTVPVGKTCPDGQCRRSLTGLCTNDCSETVCNETVPADFCGPTTMQTTTKSTRIQAAAAVQCHNTLAVLDSGPTTLTCILNSTAFNSIHITTLSNNETQWIGTFNPDTSVELSQFSIYRNITLTLVNTELIITFDVVSCDSGGIYDVTVLLDDRQDVSNGSLTILRKPRPPILQMNPDQVIDLGFYRIGHEHVCSGDVGEPPGNLIIEMKYYNSSSFEPVIDENIDIQSKKFNKQTCRNTTMTVVFGLLFTPEMDGGRIRCRVEDTPSLLDNEIIADSKDLALIQESICKCNTNSTATRGHPMVCDVFVRCTNYTVPMGLSCPLSTCRNSLTGECNSDCSTEACSLPVPKDFCSD